MLPASDLCVACSIIVGPRQETLQCDICNSWQHRKCDSGITRQFYRLLKKGEVQLDAWKCKNCKVLASDENSSIAEQETESTRLSKDNTITAIQDSTSIPASRVLNETYTISKNADTFEISHAIQELPLADTEPNHVEKSLLLTFERVPGGTKRGKDKLVDSAGYTYNIKRSNEFVTDWQCTVRNKHFYCKATVTQRGDDYKQGDRPHCHPAKKGALVKAKISSQAKSIASNNAFKSAATIVQDIFTQHKDKDFLPNLAYLARAVNRHRQHHVNVN